MNRAFLIIAAPAVLVAALYIAVGWGYMVSLPVAASLLAVAGVALLVRRRKRRPQN